MDKAIKIILAILFFLCLADMPYGFYQFVRFAGLIGFAILAYQAHEQGRQSEMIIYSGLALLFQPFFKIALGRQMWNIVDVIVGIGLLISIFMNQRKAHAKSKHICNSRKPKHRPKIAKELALPTQTKLFLKNFLTLQKNKNTPTHSPTNIADNDTKTQY